MAVVTRLDWYSRSACLTFRNLIPYAEGMDDLSQARDAIWKSIERYGGPIAVAEATRPSPGEKPAVSASMLYKFKTSNRLGRDSVNALAPLLTDVTPLLWFVAMGIEAKEALPVGDAPEATP